jgi:hypothetical protein
MKPRDWYLLLAGPALLGLAVMGCTDASASKPEVDPNTIVLSVPGMH